MTTGTEDALRAALEPFANVIDWEGECSETDRDAQIRLVQISIDTGGASFSKFLSREDFVAAKRALSLPSSEDQRDAVRDYTDYGVDADDAESLIAATIDNGPQAKRIMQALTALGWSVVRADMDAMSNDDNRALKSVPADKEKA